MNWFRKKSAPPAEETKNFALEWPAVLPEKIEAEKPLLFVSDLPLSQTAVTAILNAPNLRLQRVSRQLVVIGPQMDGVARELLLRENGRWIQAKDLPGQPLSALLTDIANFCETEVYSEEFGYGMEPPAERQSKIVMPGIPWRTWDALTFGCAKLIRANATGTRVQVNDRLSRRRIDAMLAALQREMDVTREAELRAGLEQRIRRLGGTAKWNAPASDEPTDAIIVSTRLASRFFTNDPERLESVLKNPRVLLFNLPLTEFEPLIPSLEYFATNNLSALIVAPRISAMALAGLVVNKLRGIAQIAAVTPQGDVANALAQLSAATRASVVESCTGSARETFDALILGSALEVRAGLNRCVVRT